MTWSHFVCTSYFDSQVQNLNFVQLLLHTLTLADTSKSLQLPCATTKAFKPFNLHNSSSPFHFSNHSHRSISIKMNSIGFTSITPVSITPSTFNLRVCRFTSCVVSSNSRRPHRATIQMQQDDDSSDSMEEAPSDTYVPAAEAVEKFIPGTQKVKRDVLIAKLLQIAAATERGQIATDTQKTTVDDVVMQLEEINPNPQPVETDLLDGTWTLVYTSSQLFKSNPFLLPAATPLLQVGQVRQTIRIDDGSLATEVDVVAFPVISGTVKTTARITPVGGERLELTVEKTTLTGGKIANRLDLGGINFDVPIEQIYTRIKNTSPDSYVDTYYLDEKLRISRSKQGKLYIYSRLE